MKITKVRNELNLTQKDLADAIGMSLMNWTRIESGRLDIKLKHAWQLWAYLVSKGMNPKISLIDLFK